MDEGISMEERLKMTFTKDHGELSGSAKKSSKSNSTPGDSVATLLVQGLHSGDKHILDQILDKNEDTVIRSTIEQLPVQSVPQLLKELHNRFRTKADSRPYIKWLRHALAQNASYLSSNPDVIELLCTYYGDFENRVNLMNNMLKLQGKINFLMDQYDNANNVNKFKSDEHQALAVYEDASSSETESEAEHDNSMESENDEKEWDDLDWDEHDKDQEEDADDLDEEVLKFSHKKNETLNNSMDEDDSLSQASSNDIDDNDDDDDDEEDGEEDDDDAREENNEASMETG